ncbi:MAG: guanylate kinase [Proteobacteria bacterium]|nr:guanylate kinase [Pseudomonadota bacterium]NBS06086.1 guanylate kinase [Verrucomicrobiota bacterium]NBS49543.1 guanylate kinase [Verrucomicrobiota bacterium]NBS78695.1 guanylate kinase [bacterium]
MNNFNRSGILFVVSAPSGTGKTTLCTSVRQTPDLVYSISCTTRPIRAGEKNGVDYFFLSQEEFRKKIKEGEMLETADVYGHLYGTPKAPVLEHLAAGRDVLLDIDVQGARQVRMTQDAKIKEALADIFIMPPDLEELRRRLQGRGTEDAREIAKRIQAADSEMADWKSYRYTILSSSMEEDLIKFRAIIRAERYLSRRLDLQHG